MGGWEREREREREGVPFVALIGIVFAPITPLVPPMCLLYFVVASITEKYNLL